MENYIRIEWKVVIESPGSDHRIMRASKADIFLVSIKGNIWKELCNLICSSVFRCVIGYYKLKGSIGLR